MSMSKIVSPVWSGVAAARTRVAPPRDVPAPASLRTPPTCVVQSVGKSGSGMHRGCARLVLDGEGRGDAEGFAHVPDRDVVEQVGRGDGDGDGAGSTR